MDLDFNDAEKAVTSKLKALLADFLGPTPDPEAATLDARLLNALAEGNFLGLAGLGEAGRVQAMLVIQEVARARACVPIGVQAMLGAIVASKDASEIIAIQREGRQVPLRFAAQAGLLVVLGVREALVYRVGPGDAEPVKANYGYPFGRFTLPTAQAPIATLSADLVRRRWQTAVAGEIAGAMSGALEHLVQYLSHRRQFGREIAMFQAIQHRLAELAVSLEGVRLLAFEAAWSDSSESAAVAACYAATAAHNMCLEAHQLSGAQGFSIESGLYAWTMRLQSHSVEAGGANWHAAVAASATWGVAIGSDSTGPNAGTVNHHDLVAVPHE